MHFMNNFWSETTLFIKNMICIISYQKLHFFSKNMIWRTQFHVFLYFLSSLVFFCFSTPENFHPLKLWKSSDNAFLYRKLCISCSISDQKLHILCFFLYFFLHPKISLNERDVCFLTDLFFCRVNRNRTATKYHILFTVNKKVLTHLDS